MQMNFSRNLGFWTWVNSMEGIAGEVLQVLPNREPTRKTEVPAEIQIRQDANTSPLL